MFISQVSENEGRSNFSSLGDCLVDNIVGLIVGLQISIQMRGGEAKNPEDYHVTMVGFTTHVHFLLLSTSSN